MYIYKTTNLENGKIYVGQSKFDPDENPEYLGSGYIILKAIELYGKEGFKKEILEECDDIDTLCERERYWIKRLNARDREVGYNICEGGTFGDTWSANPNKEALRQKFRVLASGKSNPNYGNTWDKRQRNNQSRIAKKNVSDYVKKHGHNMAQTPKAREKISNSKKGLKNPQANLWVLVSPEGKEIVIEGGIKRNLKSIGLHYQSFKKNNNFDIRINKQGWKLMKKEKPQEKSNFRFIPNPNKKVFKIWDNGVDIEKDAILQAYNMTLLPFTEGVCLMPDGHVGQGAPIGTVLATNNVVIPAAVSVDIGCGMRAKRLNVSIDEVKPHAQKIFKRILNTIPVGRTENGGPRDIGRWGSVLEVPKHVRQLWDDQLATPYAEICHKHPWVDRDQVTFEHLGTLGTGNHYIEVCQDQEGMTWILLHSGSRGPGARIGGYFTTAAKEACDMWYVQLPDPALAYFPRGTEEYGDYLDAMNWALNFAHFSRKIMADMVTQIVEDVLNVKTHSDFDINCHHNFAAIENHHGRNLLITRKGAVRARKKDFCIIPGSMGDNSYICRGLGNKDSFESCSHGAGRAMSRTMARKTISLDNHKAKTQGIICCKTDSVLDESPDAYKDIGNVIKAQSDLVTPVYTLKQILCVKGVEE